MEKTSSNPGLLVQGCVHRSQHHHGTQAAYIHCGCRCEQCRQAQAWARKRTRRRLVGAEPARVLLARLAAAGMSLPQIAVAAGVDPGTLARLASDASQVTAAVASRLAKVSAPRRQVSPVGAMRRLRGLMVQGFSLSFLAGRVGCSERMLEYVVAGRRNPPQNTRDAIGQVFEDLWRADPLAEGMSRRGVAMARAHAQEHKFFPPAAWDDDEIDDPATPDPKWAVGESPRLKGPELDDEILHLAGSDCPIEEAATRLGYHTVGALIKYCQRHRLAVAWKLFQATARRRKQANPDDEDLWAAV